MSPISLNFTIFLVAYPSILPYFMNGPLQFHLMSLIGRKQSDKKGNLKEMRKKSDKEEKKEEMKMKNKENLKDFFPWINMYKLSWKSWWSPLDEGESSLSSLFSADFEFPIQQLMFWGTRYDKKEGLKGNKFISFSSLLSSSLSSSFWHLI